MSPAAAIERKLAREGLRHLDYDDGAGGISVGNKGSGKVLDGTRAFARATAAEKLDERKAVFAAARTMSLDEERIYGMYAAGVSTRVIAKRTGLGRMAVWRCVRAFEARERPTTSLEALVSACEPSTLALFFALLERFLSDPVAGRAMLARVRAVPELRQLVEPEDVR